jgi:hypothetical protein
LGGVNFLKGLVNNFQNSYGTKEKVGLIMSLVDTIGKLEELLLGLTKDLPKVHRGNRSAAQRVRVNTLYLEKVGKLFRKESLRSEKSSKARKKTIKRLKRKKR